MGDRIEDYMPDFYLGEDHMQFQAFDSNLSMGAGCNMQLDSTFGPLQLRMTSPARDSLVSNYHHDVMPQPTHEKFKASNFPIMSIKIGSWEKFSRHEGDLVAKFYYAKKKIVWEFLDGALKNKIEIAFGDIEAIKATMNENQPGILEILLSNPPMFFRETNPLPKKHTIWHDSSDFTGGQAIAFRRHYVKFSNGAMDRHFMKLMQSDSRLLNLCRKPFPKLDMPYFQSNNSDNMSFGYGILPQSRSYLSSQMFPLHYNHLHMMNQNSIHMRHMQPPNLDMHYQQRNDSFTNNMFGQTIAPYYQSTYMGSMDMNEQMQLPTNMVPMNMNEQMQLPTNIVPMNMNEQMQLTTNMVPMNEQMQLPTNIVPMNMNEQMQLTTNMVPMNEQMQLMQNVIEEEHVQLPGAEDERNEILRNIEQQLLEDSPFGDSYDESLLDDQIFHNQDGFNDNNFNSYQDEILRNPDGFIDNNYFNIYQAP